MQLTNCQHLDQDGKKIVALRFFSPITYCLLIQYK